MRQVRSGLIYSTLSVQFLQVVHPGPHLDCMPGQLNFLLLSPA